MSLQIWMLTNHVCHKRLFSFLRETVQPFLLVRSQLVSTPSFEVMAMRNDLNPAWLHLSSLSMDNLQQGFGASHQSCLQL